MALGAQQRSPAPEQPPANRIAQTFRAFGRLYGHWLLAAFDSIPASKYDYKRTPVQQTVGYIAQHLEHANYQLCSLFGRASLVFCGDAIATLNDVSLADELTSALPARSRRFCGRATSSSLARD